MQFQEDDGGMVVIWRGIQGYIAKEGEKIGWGGNSKDRGSFTYDFSTFEIVYAQARLNPRNGLLPLAISDNG